MAYTDRNGYVVNTGRARVRYTKHPEQGGALTSIAFDPWQRPRWLNAVRHAAELHNDREAQALLRKIR